MHELPMNLILFKNFNSQVLLASSLTYIYIYIYIYECLLDAIGIIERKKKNVSHSKCGEKVSEWDYWVIQWVKN